MNEEKDLKQAENPSLNIAGVSGSAIKPPLGVMPKEIYEKSLRIDRFHDICRAITQYYEVGLKIDVKWIEEYNELIEVINPHYH